MNNVNLYICFFIIIVILIIIFIIINKITIKKNNILNAYSSMDIMLKKRYDLLPNLVKVIKAYTKHEKDTFEKITNLRTEGLNSKTDEDKFKINTELNQEINSIMLLSENYPELKSNINFIQLQTILNDIEDQISAARRTYNAHVTDYNIFIKIIPINILTFILGYNKYPLFEIKEEEKELKKWMNNDE